MSRLQLRLLCMLAAVLMLSGCGRPGGSGSGRAAAQEDGTKEEARLVDEECVQLLKDKKTIAEARAWLKDEQKHVLWKGDRRKLARQFDELNAAGVKEIYAVGLQSVGDGKQMTAEFVAILPSDPVGRAKAIEAYNRFMRDFVGDEEEAQDYVVADHGQKYLYYMLDL